MLKISRPRQNCLSEKEFDENGTIKRSFYLSPEISHRKSRKTENLKNI